MKLENLIQASDTVQFTCDSLRAAHKEALQGQPDEFAVIVLSGLIEDASELHTRIKAAALAAGVGK